MAIPNILDRLTAAAGLLPTTMERTLRVLRPAGLAPPGERGSHGGPDWLPANIANLVLSLASPEPIHAAEFVRAVAASTYLTTRPLTTTPTTTTPPDATKGPHFGPGSLGEILIGMIEGVALGLEMQRLGQDTSSHPNIRHLPHEIRFVHNPLRADLVWHLERMDVYANNDLFSGPDRLGPWRSSAVTRLVILPGALIHTAGEWWFDTCQRRNAAAKSENAEAPGRAPAPSHPTGSRSGKPAAQASQVSRSVYV